MNYNGIFIFLFSGKVSCVFKVTDDYGLVENRTETSLYVLAPPTASLSVSSVAVTQEQPLSVICRAHIQKTGHPGSQKGANFTWYKDGNQLGGDDSKYMLYMKYGKV